MDLIPFVFSLELQLSRCERAFRNALTLRKSGDNPLRRHHLEGALSDAWQAYCTFVRNVCIRSSLGCTTGSGVVHPSSVNPAHWHRVSYVASRTAKNKPIQAGALNSLIRYEPTWGDSTKIIPVIQALNPGNATTLIGSFAGGLLGPKHCQLVRNACAHRNHQSKAEVQSLAPFYVASNVIYPVDALTWKDPAIADFAFISWLEDMKMIAVNAVQ